MMTADKPMKALFVSHDSYRTGAPILLLHFLQGLKIQYPGLDIFIILKWGGQLQTDFEAIGKTFVLGEESPSLLERIMYRLVSGNYKNKLLKRKRRKLFSALKSQSISAIFSNTVTNGEIYDELSEVCTNIITYAHELENSIIQYTDEKSFKKVLTRSRRFIFPCDIVRNFYVTKYELPRSKTEVLPYYIPETAPQLDRAVALSNLNLGAGQRVVMGMGAPEWRKGIDIFIQVCKQYFESYPDTQTIFVWLGFVNKSGPAYTRLIYDIEKLEIKDKIMLFENLPGAINYLNAADVFLLTSREDPYPVVAIEAAMLSKPVVFFKNSGGISELLPSELAVDYADAEKAAQKVNQLLNNQQQRIDIGKVARERYLDLHSTTRRVDDLYAIIHNASN